MAYVSPSQYFLKSLEASLEERKEDATFPPLNSACVSEFFLTEEKGGESLALSQQICLQNSSINLPR